METYLGYPSSRIQRWIDEHYKPPKINYLTFTAQEAGSTLALNKTGSPAVVSLEYSTDGDAWTPYVIGTTLTLANIGDYVKFRGDNTLFSRGPWSYYQFTMTGLIAASGSIMTLLDKTDTLRDLSEKDYCYCQLFYKCSSLSSTPELPATILANNCYMSMFDKCDGLLSAPELPATTLADSCYNGMFKSCSSLSSTPELPATTLADSCYNYMFRLCSSLNYVKAACGSDQLTSTYTSNWLDGVSSTGTFETTNPNFDESITRSTNTVPAGWTIVKSAS